MKKYLWSIFIALDQLANTFLGGDPDETISSRLGKWSQKYEDTNNWRWLIAKPLCSILGFIDPNHCQSSIELDEGNNHTIE